MSGRFVWNELMTDDPERAKAFYTALFGWRIQPEEMQGTIYEMIVCGEMQIGGIVPLNSAHSPRTHWLPYLQVPGNLDDVVAKIIALGGKILQPPFAIPGVGRMAVATDPHGAVFSPYEPAGDESGAPPYPVPRGGIAWHELTTADTAAAATFYTGITGLSSNVVDMGTGPYTLLQEGGSDVRAGIMASPDPAAPAAWKFYVEIAQDSMEDALAEVRRLGGDVVMGPFEVPDVGTIGVAADPTGGWVGLMKGVS